MFRVASPDGRFDWIGALKVSPACDEPAPLARAASIRRRASPGGAASPGGWVVTSGDVNTSRHVKL